MMRNDDNVPIHRNPPCRFYVIVTLSALPFKFLQFPFHFHLTSHCLTTSQKLAALVPPLVLEHVHPVFAALGKQIAAPANELQFNTCDIAFGLAWNSQEFHRRHLSLEAKPSESSEPLIDTAASYLDVVIQQVLASSFSCVSFLRFAMST